jgi:hypothetical protein
VELSERAHPTPIFGMIPVPMCCLTLVFFLPVFAIALPFVWTVQQIRNCTRILANTSTIPIVNEN